jgi:hypothetical protein
MNSKNVLATRRHLRQSLAMLLIAGAVCLARVQANTGSSKQSVGFKQEYVPPLSFEPNQGQADHGVKFLARTAGNTMFLTPVEVVITFEHSAVRTPSLERKGSLVLTLIGGNAQSEAVAQHELPGRSSYFAGTDPLRWRTGIPTFECVQFTNVYQGIDVTYSGPRGRLEYEFSVSANSQPAQIAIEVRGVDDLFLHRDGHLVMKTGGHDLLFQPLMAYQETAVGRRFISARYRMVGVRRIGFSIGAYDRTKTLFIGPAMRNSDPSSAGE